MPVMENRATRIFLPGDILIPRDCDMSRWSVVACDQFSSQKDYWEAIETFVGDAPSTLRLMLPEAYLDERDPVEEARKINLVMKEYLEKNVFRELKDSFIYVERTLSDGTLRPGLLGLLDLEAYDYAPDAVTPIRASEGVIPERLPPRVRIRREALLEMPHILVFLNDPENIVLGALGQKRDTLKKLFSFTLCGGGGSLPIATTQSLGVVQIGYGLNISKAGVLSRDAGVILDSIPSAIEGAMWYIPPTNS